MRKVSCTGPGITAMKSPCPQRLRHPSHSPLRPVLAPAQAAQALRLPPVPLNRPRLVAVLVPPPLLALLALLPLLPLLVLMSLPLLLLELLLNVYFRWVALVDWCWLVGPLTDG